MQLGPTSRQPACRIRVQQGRFACAAFRVAFAEPGADDADRGHVLVDAIVDRLRARGSQAPRPWPGRQGPGCRSRADTRLGLRFSAPSGGRARCVPVKPAATRLCRISDPILPRSRLAPMTATTRGSKNAFIDAVAAVRDRAAAFSSKRSVTDSEMATWQTPRSTVGRDAQNPSPERRRASDGCRPARRRQML